MSGWPPRGQVVWGPGPAGQNGSVEAFHYTTSRRAMTKTVGSIWVGWKSGGIFQAREGTRHREMWNCKQRLGHGEKG